jgi:hypothetical protein
MPIKTYLSGIVLDAEATRALGTAFESACKALQLSDRTDPATELVAKKLIDLAKEGERDPELLCAAVLQTFREQRL